MLIYLSLLKTDAEKEALLALYSQYHQAMLRLARRYFPTDQMSLEDAVQNAWVKIIRNFPKIRTLEGKNRGAYCVITVKNECISLLRKRSREIPTEELETLLPQHDSQAGAAAIVALIRDMPELYRAVLEMRFVEERTTREIAQALHLPEATVNTRIFRGRKLLAERMREEELV